VYNCTANFGVYNKVACIYALISVVFGLRARAAGCDRSPFRRRQRFATPPDQLTWKCTTASCREQSFLSPLSAPLMTRPDAYVPQYFWRCHPSRSRRADRATLNVHVLQASLNFLFLIPDCEFFRRKCCICPID
jgi:hypothetical protein